VFHILIPQELRNTAILFVFRIPKPQDNLLALTSMFAVGSGSLGVHLQDVPNQPFRFLVKCFCNPIFNEYNCFIFSIG
jgi:hypothetical protein